MYARHAGVLAKKAFRKIVLNEEAAKAASSSVLDRQQGKSNVSVCVSNRRDQPLVAGLALVWLVISGTAAVEADTPTLQRFERTGVEMAVPVRLVFYAPDAHAANRAAEAALAKIHQLNAVFSDYDPESELRRLSDGSPVGCDVPVSDALFDVLAQAQQLAERTDGAFDVTIGPVVRLWRRARRRRQFPDAQNLAEARQLVGYHMIHLDHARRTARLAKPGMKLDLGGIAKGYAVAAALEVLAEHGIDRALVEAGGDIGLGGPPPGESGWRIGVARLTNDGPPSLYLRLANVAVATSGDACQFVEINGRRYSHLVDPRTGLGLTDRSTVTVIAPNSTLADALSSTVSILGPDKGLELIDATPGAAAIILRKPNETLEVFESSRWKELARHAADKTTKSPCCCPD